MSEGVPIDFKDIKVGDRVQGHWRHDDQADGDETTMVVTVEEKEQGDEDCTGYVRSREGRIVFDGEYDEVTWTLLSRPKPEFKPGQVWEFATPGIPQYRLLTSSRNGSIQFVDTLTHTWVPITKEDVVDLEYVGEAVISIKDAESRDGAPASLDAPEIGVRDA